jgi:hypothetical protein
MKKIKTSMGLMLIILMVPLFQQSVAQTVSTQFPISAAFMSKEKSTLANEQSKCLAHCILNKYAQTNIKGLTFYRLVDSSKLATFENCPHKGTISLGIGFNIGLKLAGSDMDKITNTENNFLKSLALVEQQTNSSGQVISSNPIDKYEYGEDIMVGGFKGEYFLANRLALGIHYYFLNYSQHLKATDKNGSGSVMNLNFIGPNITYFLMQKNKIGLSLKCDISAVVGTSCSVSALHDLNEQGVFDNITGLSPLIKSQYIESNVSGFQTDALFSVSWFLINWLSIEGGIGAYYYQGKQEKAIWSGVSTSFNSVSPIVNIGANFYLRNKRN